MTLGYGLGMFAFGFVAIVIIGLAGFWIINWRIKNEEEEKQRKERNKIFGK